MTFYQLSLRQAGVCALISLASVQPSFAEHCDDDSAVATIESIQGDVTVNQNASQSEHTMCAGDTIRVGPFSRAAIRLTATNTTIRIDQESQLTVPAPAAENHSILDLLEGVIYLFSRQPRAIDVNTVYANAAVEGTEFLVSVNDERTLVTVFEGRVVTSNTKGRVDVEINQTAVALEDQAPQLVETVKPEDAVQWALYYQPILAALKLPAEPDSPALVSYDSSANIAQALDTLEQVPPAQRDDNYHVSRAGLLLTVGQADAALQHIESALRLNPSSSNARSLQAIIAVTRNERDLALEFAGRAMADDPQSAAARLALSYAEQSRFELDAALASVRQAVELDPDNALAWARLAELQLSFGNLDESLRAADKAVTLDDSLARTHTVLGFANLTRIDVEAAMQAFRQATERNQADPMPRLGMGLGLIKMGKLEEGRKNIEVAVSLDPTNSLLRSYLGKAYFEEDRDNLALQQYALAMDYDPLDPTPHFYESISRALNNQPVVALRALRKSSRLNDNRSVYRSRLLLDQDHAARNISLARLYSSLGFDNAARSEAARSLAADPANHSAHRFLSDTFATLPRHEAARVSELLQSQLLQPLNTLPLRPQFADSNLAILARTSPGMLSFNEYTSLFARDGSRVFVDALIGSNDTVAEDITLAGVSGRFSYSLGQFHYETEGFRPNNDLEHDIFSGFAQFNFTPSNALQFEFLSRDTSNGDRSFNFDLDTFNDNSRREFRSDMFRIGYRYSLSPRSHLLFSAVHQNRAEDRSTLVIAPNTSISNRAKSDREGTVIEGQFLGRLGGDRWAIDLAAGLGTTFVNGDSVSRSTGVLSGMPYSPLPRIVDNDVDYNNAYGYVSIPIFRDAIMTVGLSYDEFNAAQKEPVRQLNPKFGLVWTPTDTTTLRLAAFRTLKRPLIAARTLEPVQIVGFSQIFEDIDGSDTNRFVIAADQQLSPNTLVGAELSWRSINDIPNPTSASPEQDEVSHRAYFSWTPSEQIAVSAAYTFERFEQKNGPIVEPISIETHSVPLSVRGYFPHRVFSTLSATYVRQELEKFSGSPQQPTKSTERDAFWVVDAEIGYRLPSNNGSVSLSVENILDEDFQYQDRNFQLTEPQTPLFQPERTVSLNLTFEF